MTSPEWEAANEDDADRWPKYEAHTGLQPYAGSSKVAATPPPGDGPVWRDRGVIIAQQQTRIAELEAACQRLRDDYQGALAADAAGLRARMLRLADEWDGYGHGLYNVHPERSLPCSVCGLLKQVRAALAAEPTPAAITERVWHEWHGDAPTPAAEPHAEDGALTVATAPLGTRAPAYNGGAWVRVQGGWKWNADKSNAGSTFPRPGGDWTGRLILPALVADPDDTKDGQR